MLNRNDKPFFQTALGTADDGQCAESGRRLDGRYKERLVWDGSLCHMKSFQILGDPTRCWVRVCQLPSRG